MSVEALCPTCGAVFALKEDYLGKKVRCRKCEHVFTVGGEKAKERDDDQGVQTGTGTVAEKKSSRGEDDDRTTRKPSSKRGRDDEDDEDRTRKRAYQRDRDDDDDDDDDRPRGKKAKRVYHDDDDDDDDEPRRARRKASSGGAGKVLAIIGVVTVVLLLVCGGGIYGIYRIARSAADEIDDQMQQAANNGGNPGGGGFGGLPGFERQPRDFGEAMAGINSNDANDRRGAANWLAKQVADPNRRKDVAKALEPLVKDNDDNTCAAGARAMKVWGDKDNGPALTAALRQRLPDQAHPFFTDAQKELMGALAAVKYEPAADVIVQFLPNFFAGGETEKALDAFGKGAEKAVVKHYDHPDGGTRDRARRLVQRYGTGPALILDQVVEDLKSIEQERTKAAAEWLSRPASDGALELAKGQPARRAAVAVGLNPLIETPPAFFEDTLLNAVKRWGTKDNVPALVHLLTTSPFKKRETADALIALGPACEAEVKKLLSHRDGGVVNEAKRILVAIGSADAKFVAAVEDLKSDDGGRVAQAARSLQGTPPDEKQRPAVVAALLGAIRDTGVGRGDNVLLDVAKALAAWATKDDGPPVVDKVKEMHRFFCAQSRKVLFEWMGKQKVERTIPFLAASLVDKDDWQSASNALQAMGPDLGEKIETEVSRVQATERNHLLECIKILGAVGTKKSLPLLKNQQAAATKQKDMVVVQACREAADAINARP
jgi:predicted Zn finger-like uncharacterized protein